MIYPRKHPLFDAFLKIAVRIAFRQRFYGVYLLGRENLDAIVASEKNVILCANHTNWWDGFAAGLFLNWLPNRQCYLMQHERLLGLYRPLRWFGAFGVDLDGSPVTGLRYALRLLEKRSTALWIFPQGVLVPQWYPIEVKPGACWLSEKSGATLLPVIFRYEWLVESRPSLFISVGAPLPPGTSAAELEENLRFYYEDLKHSLYPVDFEAFETVLQGWPSANKIWDWIWNGERGKLRNE